MSLDALTFVALFVAQVYCTPLRNPNSPGFSILEIPARCLGCSELLNIRLLYLRRPRHHCWQGEEPSAAAPPGTRRLVSLISSSPSFRSLQHASPATNNGDKDVRNRNLPHSPPPVPPPPSGDAPKKPLCTLALFVFSARLPSCLDVLSENKGRFDAAVSTVYTGGFRITLVISVFGVGGLQKVWSSVAPTSSSPSCTQGEVLALNLSVSCENSGS